MRFLFSAALVLLVGGCTLGGPSPTSSAASGGLTRDQAVAAARHAEPFDRVISATAGRIGSFEPRQSGVPGDRMVWAIVVTGSFQGSCGPALYAGWTPRPCPSPATRATIYIDFTTGDFVMGSW